MDIKNCSVSVEEHDINKCWFFVEERDIKIAMNKWFRRYRSMFAFTEKGKQKKKEELQNLRHDLVVLIRKYYPQLESCDFSWRIEPTRDRNFHFIKKE